MSTLIENWLGKLGLGQYAEVFVENDVDVRALPHLTETVRATAGTAVAATTGAFWMVLATGSGWSLRRLVDGARLPRLPW